MFFVPSNLRKSYKHPGINGLKFANKLTEQKNSGATHEN
jgi:hypothetical protein